MSIINTSNINTIWASLIIEELIRCGVDYFCISPGSRSTPLAVAVANHKKARSFIHFDERGSAFHALGYAAAAKKAACVITTSGTAVANLFPAVIETAKKKLPLIILTADRPPELRFTGANQTIDQVKIFGDYTNWFFDMPAPSTDCAPEFILTSIDQAVAKANGYPKGPVHLNCMFREPLAPLNDKNNYAKYLTTVKNWGKRQTPFTIYAQSQIIPEEETVQMAAQCLKKAK
ncbi:MAG: 2-succinyl-5-enolpyruvyl-6-hydroxy-3-cyclohexene-1-carboxylic-acid synthase, partial [Candidatus Omnitrophica bacterium]|nr:2-succinyl-5-enolpyruvyl-6-hydroxy-3-cyclohexene-1-carboxylic-acid synthase [Candidatus Omnitrophota bacterium]